MQDFAFYNAACSQAAGIRRTIVPFRRLVRRLLRPVFQRQAELFRHFSMEIDRLAQRLEMTQIKLYLAENDNCYVGVGGLGDALLTIAIARADPDAHIVFAANPQIQEVVGKFFSAFALPALIVGFPSDKVAFWQLVSKHRHCRSLGALPENLDWDHEWVLKLDEYTPRLVTRMPLKELFGTLANPRATKGIVGLAPRSAWKGTYKRKDLSKDEYHRLVKKHIQGCYTVFTFGSPEDLAFYGMFPHDNAYWYSTDFMVSFEGKRLIDMVSMFAAINSCAEVISVDTWLKTYSAMAGIPTKVILSRNPHDDMHIYMNDSGDRIFLNPHLWNIRLVGLADLSI